jgi:two-component system CheB/CheR fusion protein
MNRAEDARFENLLLFLQQQRGFDFTGYKRPSLMRRVLRRMHTLGLSGFDAYCDYLQVHPDEFALLFNTILINVTSFFRDSYAWDYLAKNVVPDILAGKAAHEPVRVWSAGCAAGQEAYSIAMLLAEAVGAEAFRERVKVYATDADEEALTQARLATYSAKEVEDVPEPLLKRYFEPSNARYVFRADLRRSVIFGRHDLVSDAPISRLDLLVCRNTLMYFNAETQARILQRFHFALNGYDGRPGYLFLGRAEMMLAQSHLFATKDLKCRVFLKVPVPGARPRLPLAKLTEPNGEPPNIMSLNERLRELALHDSTDARILVDANGTLALANNRARLLFSLSPKDVGRPLQDLEISYRPVELRSLIEQAYAEHRPVTRANVERHFPDGQSHYLDVLVSPLFDEAHQALGVGITFIDVTRSHRLQEELQRSREEIQTANEELQSSNEELETTNEELQSSNEELETTNEELQSTNEELETMNEELQSTNEELQTVNEDLRQRTEELNQSNSFLQSVLSSMRGAAIVVNRELNVLVWNHRAEDLWGLRQDEVQGRSVLNLDIGLPVGELRAPMRACMNDGAEYKEIVLDAVNRRGKSIRCRIACTPLLAPDRKREGVILMMDELL